MRAPAAGGVSSSDVKIARYMRTVGIESAAYALAVVPITMLSVVLSGPGIFL